LTAFLARKRVWPYSNYASNPIAYLGLDRNNITILGERISWSHVQSIHIFSLYQSGGGTRKFLAIEMSDDLGKLNLSKGVLGRATKCNKFVIRYCGCRLEKNSFLCLNGLANLTVPAEELYGAALVYLRMAKHAETAHH